MIFRTPTYYKDFRCIADKCKDSCCIGWEIDIDKETAEHYASVSGAFGERLQKNICFGEISSFVLDQHERCPFLNAQGLCDVYTELGESALSQICTDHPRYYEWFGDLKEGGVGMCCEAAAMLILTADDPCDLTETKIPEPADEEDFDAELFSLLTDARNRIFHMLMDESRTLSERLAWMFDFSSCVQEYLDSGENIIPQNIISLPPSRNDMRHVLQFFQSLQPMSEGWISALARASERMPEIIEHREDFLQAHPEAEKYLRNIAVYFIWRHFLKGTFDGEIFSRTCLALSAVLVISVLWIDRWLDEDELSTEDCAEMAKNFSKEIEYNEENLSAMQDAAYGMGIINLDYFFKKDCT